MAEAATTELELTWESNEIPRKQQRLIMHSLETSRFRLRLPEEPDFPVYKAFFENGEASHFYGGPLRADSA